MASERIFIKTHSIEGRCVIRPENILFAGAPVHLSARNFTGSGSDGVLIHCINYYVMETDSGKVHCLDFFKRYRRL